MSVLDHLIARARGLPWHVEPLVESVSLGAVAVAPEPAAPAPGGAPGPTPMSLEPSTRTDRRTSLAENDVAVAPSVRPERPQSPPPARARPSPMTPTTDERQPSLRAPSIRPMVLEPPPRLPTERELIRERVVHERFERVREIEGHATPSPSEGRPGAAVVANVPPATPAVPLARSERSAPSVGRPVVPVSQARAAPPGPEAVGVGPRKEARPSVAPSIGFSDPRPADREAVPTTHVSIGRIIVSVEPPPRQRSRSSNAAPTPAVTLAEFLAARERGKR